MFPERTKWLGRRIGWREETGMVEEHCKLIVDETGAVVDQVCEIVD